MGGRERMGFIGYGAGALNVRRRMRPICAVGTGFRASDFEIVRQVGQQGYYEVTEWEYYERRDPTQPTRTVKTSKPAIRLYDGKVIAGPLRNTRVLLKEFLEPAYEIGVREAEVYKKFLELEDVADLPVAELLGSFAGDEGFDRIDFQRQWERNFPRSGGAPKPGSPWLVFCWQGNLTAAGFAKYEQTENFVDRFLPQNRMRRRRQYIRKLMQKALEAVKFLHARGFVHRSLGPASILVNTLEEQDANVLDVKLRDFGFGCSVFTLDDRELKKARDAGAISPSEVSRYFFSDDIYALGYAFMEIIFSSLSTNGPGPQTSQEAFKRLFEDVYKTKVADLREYCSTDEANAAAVELLDADNFAGWTLLGLMLSSLQEKSRQSAPQATDLLESQFLRID